MAAAAARTTSLRAFARAWLGRGLLVGTLIVAASVAVGPSAARLLFGEYYGPSAVLFAVLSSGLLLNYAGNPISQVLYMTHRAHIMVVIQVLQLVVFVGLAGLAAARWGAMGLAVTRAAVNLTSVAIVIGVSLAVARQSAVVGTASTE
jgi:O-antigen/teichoic acid export membrane protein